MATPLDRPSLELELPCPKCARPLGYLSAYMVVSVSRETSEMTDYFRCPFGCGVFEYRKGRLTSQLSAAQKPEQAGVQLFEPMLMSFCRECDGHRWQCERHASRPWQHDGCHAIGIPCPWCNTSDPPLPSPDLRSFVSKDG
jgi:hypothetical protein